MPPRKRSRDDEFVAAAPAAEEASRGRPLPADLLLEIVARSDAATLLRCAATCRSLRRDILLPAFIRRVCHDGHVPPRLLGFLRLDLRRAPMPPPSFSLAYPATPAAASLAKTHLASFVSAVGADAERFAAGYYYQTLTSRDGLVLLRHMCWSGTKQKMVMVMSSMCVYDPMTVKGTFFPGPPDSGAGKDQDVGPGLDSYYYDNDKFVLLTAADGVGCPFLTAADGVGCPFLIPFLVLLTASSNGRRLSLLVMDKFKVTVWLLMSGDGGGVVACWARSALIDTERTVHAAFRCPYLYGCWPDDVAVVGSGARSAAVVLLPYQHLLPHSVRHDEGLGQEFIVLDLETKEMHTVIKENDAFLYEIDLASRLSAMKRF